MTLASWGAYDFDDTKFGANVLGTDKFAERRSTLFSTYDILGRQRKGAVKLAWSPWCKRTATDLAFGSVI